MWRYEPTSLPYNTLQGIYTPTMADTAKQPTGPMPLNHDTRMYDPRFTSAPTGSPMTNLPLYPASIHSGPMLQKLPLMMAHGEGSLGGVLPGNSHHNMASSSLLQMDETRLRQELIATKLKLQFYEKQQREEERKQAFLHQAHHQNKIFRGSLVPGYGKLPISQAGRSVAPPPGPPILPGQMTGATSLSQQEQLLLSLRSDTALAAAAQQQQKMEAPLNVAPLDVTMLQRHLAAQKIPFQTHPTPTTAHAQAGVVNVSLSGNEARRRCPPPPAIPAPLHLIPKSSSDSVHPVLSRDNPANAKRQLISPAHSCGKSPLTNQPKPPKSQNKVAESGKTDTIVPPTAPLSIGNKISTKKLLHALTLEIMKVVQKRFQDDGRRITGYDSMAEAIKRGEFRELSENCINVKCCQSSETSMFNDDDLMDEIQIGGPDVTTETGKQPLPAPEGNGDQAPITQTPPPLETEEDTSSAQGDGSVTSKHPSESVSRPRGRPRKSTLGKRPPYNNNSSQHPNNTDTPQNHTSLSELKPKPFKIRLTDSMREGGTAETRAPCAGKCHGPTIKEEPLEIPQVKEEPIETESYFPEPTELKKDPVNGTNVTGTKPLDNTTIANQLMGNIQQMFMMLQKDAEEVEDDSLDLNSFLTNS